LFRKGIIFQNDVASLSYLLLKKYPSVIEAIISRFPIIIVDEAQDTSIEQMAVLDLLNNAGLESMFLVGDPDQSIYEWRDASPECFFEKMNCREWTTLPLTTNFRSSQLICNATHVFSKSLEKKTPSKSMGLYSDCNQKPILFLYDEEVDKCKARLIEDFLTKCVANEIDISPENVAIVTRSKVYTETDINELWKSKEVELIAQASYEWHASSKRKAYDSCEKALFSLLIKGFKDINISIQSDIEEIMPYREWRENVVDILVNLPDIELPLEQWIKKTRQILDESFSRLGLVLRTGINITKHIAIKARDKKFPQFKSISTKCFFEKKFKENYTLSSVHGVKGETFEAIMLIVEGKTGNTLTPSFLNKGKIDQELMRIAYVAMTRPRKLLAVAMPTVKGMTTFPRFPNDKWDYIRV
jgi:superfamily I DNA/RNA helicase